MHHKEHAFVLGHKIHGFHGRTIFSVVFLVGMDSPKMPRDDSCGMAHADIALSSLNAPYAGVESPLGYRHSCVIEW